MKIQPINKKICLLGIFGVGKTSLIQRFVYNRFDDAYLSTIGVKVTQKITSPYEDSSGKLKQFNFLIWDIEGFEENQNSTNNYYLGAAGAIVVSDLTRKGTIEKIPLIIEQFFQVSPEAKIVLVGNKLDLVKQNSEEIKLLKNQTEELNYKLFLSSAKTGESVENTFNHLGQLFLE